MEFLWNKLFLWNNCQLVNSYFSNETQVLMTGFNGERGFVFLWGDLRDFR